MRGHKNHSGVVAVGVFESSGSPSSLGTGAGAAKGGGLCKVWSGVLVSAGLKGKSDPKKTC